MSAKIALVTGGSRGLGKDMALSLAKKKIDVIITYRSKEQEANEVVAQIEALGQKAAALYLDMSKFSSLDSFIKDLLETLQKKWNTASIDFIINNAGMGGTVPFEQVTEEFFNDFLNVHFKGIYFLTQRLLPNINHGGSIINISTGTTRFANPGYSVYAGGCRHRNRGLCRRRAAV